MGVRGACPSEARGVAGGGWGGGWGGVEGGGGVICGNVEGPSGLSIRVSLDDLAHAPSLRRVLHSLRVSLGDFALASSLLRMSQSLRVSLEDLGLSLRLEGSCGPMGALPDMGVDDWWDLIEFDVF